MFSDKFCERFGIERLILVPVEKKVINIITRTSPQNILKSIKIKVQSRRIVTSILDENLPRLLFQVKEKSKIGGKLRKKM